MSVNEEKTDAGFKQDASNEELKEHAISATNPSKNEAEGGNGIHTIKSSENDKGTDSSFFLNDDGTPKSEGSPWTNHFKSHFNMKDMKVLFKSSMAVWIYTLFIFINPTLKTYGQAAFFGR